MTKRLDQQFFLADAVDVAQALVGKVLVRRFDSGLIIRRQITETEAYRGEDDRACHASKGLTPRTKVMYQQGALVYVYLIYGMYWMLNFVCSEAGFPAAVLIRSVEGTSGPGRVGRLLGLDGSFYGEDLTVSQRIWLEDHGNTPQIKASARIGVAYAGSWALKPWRFTAE